ncbi:MAG: hypothetical protein WCL70_08025 [Paludibacter sp.]
MNTLLSKFKSKTHPVVKVLQLVLIAISAAALYYGGLPDDWKLNIPAIAIKTLSTSGLVLTFLLQFTSQKTSK